MSTPIIPQTTKAMVYDSSGPGRMSWHSTHQVPKPGKNEVLIKVASSSVNPLDYRVTESHSMFMSRRNKIVGTDVAGTIVGVGRNVTNWSIGDKVFGFGAGYANFAVANQLQISRVPSDMDLSMFGVYPLVATTAYQTLKANWLEKPNYTVRSLLVIGASGGVGSCLLQMARHLGGPEVRIYALCASKDVDYCRDLGASESIDYTVNNFDLARSLPIHSLDLIIDVVSGTPESTNYVAQGGMLLLKASGAYVVLNSQSTMDWIRARLSKTFGVNLQRTQYNLFTVKQAKSTPDLDEIARMISHNKLKLSIADDVPLTETPIRRAIHIVKQRHVRGKIRIKPNEETPQGYTTPTTS